MDAAASAAEAVGKLDERQYELVLSDLEMESPEAGLKCTGARAPDALQASHSHFYDVSEFGARHAAAHVHRTGRSARTFEQSGGLN